VVPAPGPRRGGDAVIAALGLLLLAGMVLHAPARSGERTLRQVGGTDEPAAARRNRRLPLPAAAVLGAVGTAVVVGGPIGVVLGATVGVGVLAVVPRLEPRAVRRRRLALAAQTADLVDLLAACLAAGATTQLALEVVAAAVDDPGSTVLRRVAAALRLGADPGTAWAAAAAEAPLAPLAAAAVRSAESGVALAGALPLLADDLRAQRRAQTQEAVSRVGVRLTAPLGLAFLPAFVLLGVVPVVASLVTGVLLSP
jgi:pilus assembly protein TadC